MTETSTGASSDDPRVEILQAVYDRVNSYEESAAPEKIRVQLDDALAEAGIEIDDELRDRIVQHIDDKGGREDVAGLL